MAKGRPSPCGCAVTGRTLTAEMIGRPVHGVTGLAIGLSLMVKAGRFPGIRVMACRTLAGKVVGRLILRVARLAVGQPLVTEGGARPGGGIVAG